MTVVAIMVAEFLDFWMNVVSAHVKDQRIKTILDLGCGTGRFSEALRARFEAEVIGIDPSKKMLEQARSQTA
jgi:trans-aconitate methyltransferase